VVACLDGSHIPIIRPSKSGTGYYNRMGFYSINVQGMHFRKFIWYLFAAAVDHKRRFVSLVVGWPGSVHDGRVWRNSTLKQNLATFLSSIHSFIKC
jgi:DDE superfamily endonuclease